jgi:hypothetical protein
LSRALPSPVNGVWTADSLVGPDDVESARHALLAAGEMGLKVVEVDGRTWRFRQTDPGYATQNVTAVTPDELEALASWGDAIRWVQDREPCSCACHREEPRVATVDGPILQEDVDDYHGGVVPPGRWAV